MSIVRGRTLPVLLAALAAACGTAPPPELPPPADTVVVDLPDPTAEILWDTWGVPHIFAQQEQALFRAFGWAQARAHADLLLRLYGEARGRAAEYRGADYAEHDRWLRINGVPARAQQWLDEQTPQVRGWLDAFTDGINAWAETYPDSIAEDAARVLPVGPVDVMAHYQRVLFFSFLASPDAMLGQAQAWGARAEARDSQRLDGSNAWAIGPARSESKHALLLGNPHLPWSGHYTWFEAQLTGAGLNAYGATLVGFPLPGIAFNDRLGWTHTVNTIDPVDLYELTLTADGYRWDGAQRAFESREDTLRIRQPDGTITEERFTVRSSLHGPVIAEREDGTALALRVAGLDRSQYLLQLWRMLRSSTLSEFETAAAMLQLPLFSIVYADVDGHILHVSNGFVPVRARGGWRDWSGIVPGDSSSWLWTALHPYAELPRLADPGSGFLQNANEPPWTTTFPVSLRASAYPSYMAPPPAMSLRAQSSARMLFEDLSISFDEMVRYKHSTRVTAADHMLDDVLVAVRAQGSGLARRAAAVLADWDRTTDADSRGGILFEVFWRELLRATNGDPFDVQWMLSAPLGTPDGIADPDAAAAALATAATQVEAEYGALDVPWGNVHRLRAPDVDLPANGAGGHLGVFRVTNYASTDDDARVAVAGDSWIMAVEFGPTVRARALVAYGNASRTGSEHRGDQLRLYAGKRLRDVWRTRAEIEENLQIRERF